MKETIIYWKLFSKHFRINFVAW